MSREPFAIEQSEQARTTPSIAALYEHHGPRVARFAYVLTGDAEAARDLVQDAFVRVVARRIRGKSDPSVFDRYLRTAILNLWRSKLRRRKLERRYDAEARPEGPAFFPDVETGEVLWGAIRRLNPRERAAIYLKYYEDLPIASIAQELDCSEAATRSLLMRAVDKLRKDSEVTSGR